jgi:hypothetical protein
MPDNQTDDGWLQLPAVASNPHAEGTGVILKQAGGTKSFIWNVTYDKLLLRDKEENFFAFSWVPHVVATEDQVKAEPCGGRCSKTCKRPGCLCDRSIGKCL